MSKEQERKILLKKRRRMKSISHNKKKKRKLFFPFSFSSTSLDVKFHLIFNIRKWWKSEWERETFFSHHNNTKKKVFSYSHIFFFVHSKWGAIKFFLLAFFCIASHTTEISSNKIAIYKFHNEQWTHWWTRVVK